MLLYSLFVVISQWKLLPAAPVRFNITLMTQVFSSMRLFVELQVMLLGSQLINLMAAGLSVSPCVECPSQPVLLDSWTERFKKKKKSCCLPIWINSICYWHLAISKGSGYLKERVWSEEMKSASFSKVCLLQPGSFRFLLISVGVWCD